MPVLSLACHLPHNTPNIPSRYNNEQTTKQTKAINNSYIYISHVNVTQTVPDISPLMPMHQDPLLVLQWDGTNISNKNYAYTFRTTRNYDFKLCVFTKGVLVCFVVTVHWIRYDVTEAYCALLMLPLWNLAHEGYTPHITHVDKNQWRWYMYQPAGGVFFF